MNEPKVVSDGSRMSDQHTREWRKDGWRVVADRHQVFGSDPGQGTPLMVHAPDGSSATLNCALDTGQCEYTSIPDDIYRWLDENVAERAERFVFGD